VNNLGGIVGIVLAIFGAAGMLAGVAGYTRGSSAKSRIEALNGDIVERDRRHELLRSELGEERQARQETDRKLQAETAARTILQDVVTGKQDWAEITAILRVMDERGVNIQQVLDSIATATGAAE
jgi:hypothetical protein